MGRQHDQWLRWKICPEIKRTRRQFQLAEIAETAQISVCLGEIEQADTLDMQDLSDGLRCRGISHQESGVDLMLEQSLYCRFPRQVDELGWTIWLNFIGLHQRHGKKSRAASFVANGNTLPFKLGKALNRPGASISNHERLVEYTSKRHNIADVATGRNASLHESDTHAGIRIGQAPEVIQ